MKNNKTFVETTEERRCERISNLIMPMWRLSTMVLESETTDKSLKDIAKMAEDSKDLISKALDINTGYNELGQLYINADNREPLWEADEIDEIIDDMTETYRALVYDLRKKQNELRRAKNN